MTHDQRATAYAGDAQPACHGDQRKHDQRVERPRVCTQPRHHGDQRSMITVERRGAEGRKLATTVITSAS